MRYLTQKFFTGKVQVHASELYLAIILLIFGTSACFLLPIGGGYDEETHLKRVWEMSSLKFIPNEKLGSEMPFPAIYWNLSYRRQPIVRHVYTGFYKQYKNSGLDSQGYIYSALKTRSVYSPALLLPQAIVMRYLGRSWQWPALTVFYAIRLIGLLSYLLLVWGAVRLVPFGKWVLAIIATAPSAILQAATISADPISNGLAFLFIGGILAVAQRKELYWKEWATLVFLFFILFFGKINNASLALLPFLLIQASKFKNKYGYVALIATAIGLFALEVLGWNILAYSRYPTALEGADPTGQIQFILTNPLKFIAALANTTWADGVAFLYSSTAIYGYNYWPVPTWTYYFFWAGILIALLTKDQEIKDKKRTIIGLGIVFIATYLATLASLYVTFTPVGSNFVSGVQGRYFAPAIPLGLLVIYVLFRQKRILIPASGPIFLSVMGLMIYLLGMYLVYHVNCGAQFYVSGLCYQPRYKNWAPDDLYSAPISNKLILEQEIFPECDGMTQLRIWIDTIDVNPNGQTEFILKDFGQGVDVIQTVPLNDDLPAKGWYTLTFQPEWESSSKSYTLSIRSNDDDTTGPRVAYSMRPEYLEGKLYENGTAIGNDILFQTGCVAGFEKIRQTTIP